MELSAMMGARTQQLQHTLNLSLIQSSLSSQAAASIAMLDQMKSSNASERGPTDARHPYAGKHVDISL